jgi:hypothetical protein
LVSDGLWMIVSGPAAGSHGANGGPTMRLDLSGSGPYILT